MKNFILKVRRFASIVLFLFIFLLLFNSIKVKASTTQNANYYDSLTIKTESLEYGISYRSTNGFSKSTSSGSEVKQVNNIIEIPSMPGLVITSWSAFQSSAWKMSHVDTVAQDYERTHPGYRVIAAINADFYDINGTGNFPYQPNGVTISDGNVYKSSTSSSNYNVLSFKNDGTGNSLEHIINRDVIRHNTPTIAVYDENDNIIKSFRADDVNKKTDGNKISVYFGTFTKKQYNGITVESDNQVFVCDNAIYSLPNKSNDYYGLGYISSLGCKYLPKGSFAISSGNEELNQLLKENVKVRIQYEYENINVVNGVNAGTQILVNGEAPSDVNTNDGDRMNARHPRTAIGVKKDGTIVFLVNDGRQANIGRNGTYGNELAAIMKEYGCVNAFNLDGGGSSIMYYRNKEGKFVLGNKYSDASERSISNCVLVAVKDPVINTKILNDNPRNFVVKADIVNKNNHKIDKLYASITVGSKVYEEEVIDGIATFKSLSPLININISYMYKYNGTSIFINPKVKTATGPMDVKISGLEVTKLTDSYKVRLKYTDRGKATNLATAKLFINGKEYNLVDGIVNIPLEDFTEITITKVVYECLTIDGKIEKSIDNFHAPFKNCFINILEDLNILVSDIYK